MLSVREKFTFVVLILSAMLFLSGASENKSLPNKEVWLDQLNTSKAYSAYGPTRRKRKAEKNPPQIASKQYERGICMRAPCQFYIDLKGKALRFTAMVGIDDETNGQGSSVFKIVGDGRVLWSSDIIKAGRPPVKVDLDISGINLLGLIVTDAGDGHLFDLADWVDAKIIMRGQTRPFAVYPPRGDEFAVLQKQLLYHNNNLNKDLALKISEQVFNSQSLIHDTDRDPVDIILRRIEALIRHLEKMADAPDLSDHQRRLKRYRNENSLTDVTNVAARRKLFTKVTKLRREISFSNPLLNCDKILFLKRHFNANDEKRGNHMCDQYFGFHALKGGGIFVLDNPFSDNPKIRNVLENSICENGRFKGRKLTSEGGFLSPELSFDGKTIFFAYTGLRTTHTISSR
ncbi:MAG: NPCBM/NEW2 domain-containing protein [Planctomycetota bacterium]|jgi:hypothetical protein